MTLTLQSSLNKLSPLATQPAQHLPPADGQQESWHLWQPYEVNAITLALASQRPLLVRGEPGTGKTQLARAAAVALGWLLHSSTLHARSEAQVLLYQFDAVRRLADAQAGKFNQPGWTQQDEKAYWQPQALWKALDWLWRPAAVAQRAGAARGCGRARHLHGAWRPAGTAHPLGRWPRPANAASNCPSTARQRGPAADRHGLSACQCKPKMPQTHTSPAGHAPPSTWPATARRCWLARLAAPPCCQQIGR